jgi:MFS family permease
MVYGFVDIKVFLLFNGLSFIGSGISEMFINFDLCTVKAENTEENRPEISFEKIWGDMKQGFAYLRDQELLFTLCLCAILINFFFNFGMAVPLPYIINHLIQLESTQFGIIEGAVPIGILVASILLSIIPEFKKKYKVMRVALMVLTFALILIGVPAIPALMTIGKTKIFLFYVFLCLGMGFAQMFINMPVWVMMQRETPDQYRGRVFGLVQTMVEVSTPIGYLLAGILIELIPAYFLPFAAGLIMLILLQRLLRNPSLRQM